MTEYNSVTPELLRAIEEHNRNAIKLDVPTMPVSFVELLVESPDGELVHRHYEKAHSWTRNMYNIIASQFLPSLAQGTFGAGSLTIKDISGTSRENSNTSYGTRLYSPDGVTGNTGGTSFGVVLGTSNSAEDFEGYALGSLIAHGTGSGQLTYTESVCGYATYDSGTWTQTFSRVANNNSGGSITVNEIGIYALSMIANASRTVLIDRTLLSPGVAVPDAYKLTATYTTQLTFPS